MNAPLVPPTSYPGPLPLLPDQEVAAPYPLAALGEVLGGAAQAIVDIVQVPAALAAQSVLAAAAMAAQPHANVLRAGQPIPLSLYMLTVAESGDRKTTADRLALRAHQQRQLALLGAYDEALIAYRNQKDAFQRVRGQTLDKAKDDVQVLADKLGDLKEPQAPRLPFILVQEPTLEGLQKSFLYGQPSQGLFSDEGGQFFGGHANRPENLLRTAAALSCLWDGSPFSRIRGTDGESAHGVGCRLSAHLMIQPVVAHEVLNNPILQGQGFLARFLLSWPQSLAGSRFYRNLNPDQEPRLVRYWRRMAQLLARTPILDAYGGLAPSPLEIEEQALASWIVQHDRIEEQLGCGGDLQEIRATAAKGAENLLRIAGVMAVIEESSTITQALIERAATLMEGYLAEALRVGNPVKVEVRLAQAQRLLDWLRANDWQSFEIRELQRKGPRFARKSAQQLKELLGILLEHHHLVSADGRVFRLVPGGDSGDNGDRPDAARD